VKVKLFLPVLNIPKKKTYSEVLTEELKSTYKNVDLIVTDVNLSEIESYKGLSAEVVEEVGRKLLIPVCIYSAKVGSDTDRIQEVIDTTIWLKSPAKSPEMIQEIIELYNGFTLIKKSYNRLNSKQKSETPAQMLSRLLHKPQYSDRFALYGLGNQAFGSFSPKKPNFKSKLNSIPYLLAHWLLVSILKFPGVLLNKVAAASYLDISPEDFEDIKIRNVFKTASYKGPFSNLQDFWWRYELDNIIGRNKSSSGLELVQKKISKNIKPCKCNVDPNLNAGYYCIITDRPVSMEKSTSEISWIPKGADLTRVSIPIYNKLKPWIGIL
jgi:hypothetical protein